jgi:hypothetical protein
MCINFFIGQSGIATIYHSCVALLYPLFHIRQCTILLGAPQIHPVSEKQQKQYTHKNEAVESGVYIIVAVIDL